MERSKTNRGFGLIEFEDLYGAKCSIQKSSLVAEHAIWLGVSDAEPKIMASRTPEGGEGWIPYEIPDHILLTTRMHLNQEQAKALVKELKVFIKTGYLKA